VVKDALQSTLLCRRLAAYLPVTHHAAVSCHAAEAAPRRSTGTLRAASRAALAPHSPPERTQAPSAAKLEHRSAARAAARRIVRGQQPRAQLMCTFSVTINIWEFGERTATTLPVCALRRL